MEFVTIESRFGVPENIIRANTRNECSKSFVAIIKELTVILYPDEEFEIYLLPPKPGSYKDIIKIVKKNPLGAITAVATVGTLAFVFLTYCDSHQEHKHNEKMQVVDDTAKCLALNQQMEELGGQYSIENIPQGKLTEVCGNLKLKRLKNDRYQILENDEMVAGEETTLRDHNQKTIIQKEISKKDFTKYIESIPENEEYLKTDLSGVIELVSLVVKQKKEGRGIAWKGVYHGDDIIERGVSIISNEDEINFYMQDDDFKDQITKHQITFSSGDNIRVVFNIKGALSLGFLQNRSIYVKEVIKFNEDIIKHKVKPTQRKNIILENQASLF